MQKIETVASKQSTFLLQFSQNFLSLPVLRDAITIAMHMHVWTLNCHPKKLETLIGSLAHLDPTRLAVTRIPRKQRQIVQYFTQAKSEASQMQLTHGGTIQPVSESWKTARPAHPAIRIRDRFLIVETPGEPPDEKEIVIPAGLAFGTGDHPTTASCLRLLCDVARQFSKKWSALDVGTGSGLLAIAAKKLGATRVEGFDYDPFAIRTARDNARENSVRGIVWKQSDLLQFSSESQFNVVTANIFSELFLASKTRIFAALQPGGYLILSGILRFQADEIRASFLAADFLIKKEIRLGKWITFLAQSPPAK